MKPTEFVNRHFTAIVMVVFATILYIAIGRKCGLQPGDWGTWTGGIGTVGTLFGTIWLATDQSRKAERINTTVARLHVVALRTRVREASEACRVAGIRFDSLKSAEYSGSAIEEVRKQIEGICLWSLDELIPIATLPTKTAATLAETLGDLAKLQNSLNQKITKRNFDGPVSRRQSFTDLATDANKIHLMLEQIGPDFSDAKYHLNRES